MLQLLTFKCSASFEAVANSSLQQTLQNLGMINKLILSFTVATAATKQLYEGFSSNDRYHWAHT
jgi:hypothetical protein